MSTPPSPAASPVVPSKSAPRLTSIDALRGLVMAAMIFVNDLAGAGGVVPDWMVHYSERHPGGSGMTFVDLVFPAFLFIVGLSLPFALEASLRRPGGWPRTLRHIGVRTASLLLIGVLMVNESPDAAKLGWSPALWSTLLFLGAIAAFSDLATAPERRAVRYLAFAVRGLGFGLLAFLAFTFVGADGHRILTFAPLRLSHDWWGILGLIGWAYLVGAVVFLLFRGQRTALLGCFAVLFCLYPAERAGWFDGLWLAHHVSFGSTLGSQAAITVGGLLLASVLLPSTGIATAAGRIRFTLLFAGGAAVAALLLHGLYGLSKNAATPPWCLWACAITAVLWLVCHLGCDLRPVPALSRPLAAAGQNVLLAYLLSQLLPPLLELLRLDTAYGQLAASLGGAIGRSLALAIVLLVATVRLNRAGFRLKL